MDLEHSNETFLNFFQKDVKDMGETGFTLAQTGDNVTVSYSDSAPQSGEQDIKAMTTSHQRLETNGDTPQNETNSPVIGSEEDQKTPVGSEMQELAIHFSSWFYKLLDSLANATPGTNTIDWGPQHFWEDAKLTVECNEPSGLQETTVEGAQLVSEKFYSMVVVDQLYFNPNISSDSVKGVQNPHGLVMVMVCGTVHRQKQYLGVFEQSFGLIRDPSEENNWKIKLSKLMLKASGSSKNHVADQEPQNQLEGEYNSS